MKKLIFAVFAMMFAQCVMAQGVSKAKVFHVSHQFAREDVESVASYKDFRFYLYFASDMFSPNDRMLGALISGSIMDYEEVCGFLDALKKVQEHLQGQRSVYETTFDFSSKEGVGFKAVIHEKSNNMYFYAKAASMDVNDREISEVIGLFAKLKAAMEKYPELIK